MIRQVGGYLFSTTAAAEAFAEEQTALGDEHGAPRGPFSHKRVDGLRLYQYRGGAA